MFYYEIKVGNHNIWGFSMSRKWAKETVLIEVRTLWAQYGWAPAEWEIHWEHGEEGGTLWRA